MNSKLLFFFLDGVGLGRNEPEINPFARAEMPVLEDLLGGKKLLEGSNGFESSRATLFHLDPMMGVEDVPQSASGQASLLTGKRVPELIGYHYGPKPNPEIAAIIKEGTIFSILKAANHSAALLNAYPGRYFDGIKSGLRLYSAIPLAVTSAGIPLMDAEDYYQSRAISVDFTGEAWRTHLGYSDAPLRKDHEAGVFLAHLASNYDFAFFEFWVTDMLGHRQDMDGAIGVLEKLDRILAGLMDGTNFGESLILITSDHGNMEDLSTRRHTMNPVPALLIGEPELRDRFQGPLDDLSDVSPGIESFLKT